MCPPSDIENNEFKLSVKDEIDAKTWKNNTKLGVKILFLVAISIAMIHLASNLKKSENHEARKTQQIKIENFNLRNSARIPKRSKSCGRKSPSSGLPDFNNKKGAGCRIEIHSRSNLFHPKAAETKKISIK